MIRSLRLRLRDESSTQSLNVSASISSLRRCHAWLISNVTSEMQLELLSVSRTMITHEFQMLHPLCHPTISRRNCRFRSGVVVASVRGPSRCAPSTSSVHAKNVISYLLPQTKISGPQKACNPGAPTASHEPHSPDRLRGCSWSLNRSRLPRQGTGQGSNSNRRR